MSPLATMTVEMALGDSILDVAEREILDLEEEPIRDLGFTPISVLANPGVSIRQGINGVGINDRVGDPAEASFTLDNSDGRYTPDGVNCDPSFIEGTQTRVTLEYGGVTDVTLLSISDIEVSSGNFNPRTVRVRLTDWMGYSLRTKTQRLPVQLEQRADQVIATLLAACDLQPGQTELAVDPGEFAVSLHDEQDEQTPLMSVLQKVATSALGFVFIRSDETLGETLVYQSRTSRLVGVVPVAELVDSMDTLPSRRSESDRIRKVTAISYPVTLDSDNETVVFTTGEDLYLGPGESLTFVAPYEDPNQAGRRISAVDHQAPENGTDYTFSTVKGSGSNDLTGDLSVVVGFGGNSALVTITSLTSGGYVALSLRGRGVYVGEGRGIPASSSNQASGTDVSLDMVYNSDSNFARDVASVLLGWGEERQNEARLVSFTGSQSDDLMEAALVSRTGEAVSLTESVSEISQTYFVQQRTLTITDMGFVRCSLTLIPARSMLSWSMGTAGFSEMGETTVVSL